MPLQDSSTSGKVRYLKPSFRYPAASAYQLAKGTIHRFSHGRFNTYFVNVGADMIVSCALLSRSCRTSGRLETEARPPEQFLALP